MSPRLMLSCLSGLLAGAPVSSHAREEPVVFYLVDAGAAPGPAILSVEVQSAAEFSCMNYTLPVSARVGKGEIEVRVGAVVPPKGGICLTALGPARGSASLGTLAAGSYRLRLVQGRTVDQYTLTVSDDSTELKPQQGRFSTSSFQSVYRVAAGAAHVACLFGQDARCAERARQGAPTCETLFADPAVAALTPLPSRPGPYSQSWFNESGRRYAAPAFDTLRPVVTSERYRDTQRCLSITVHSGRGESVENVRF